MWTTPQTSISKPRTRRRRDEEDHLGTANWDGNFPPRATRRAHNRVWVSCVGATGIHGWIRAPKIVRDEARVPRQRVGDHDPLGGRTYKNENKHDRGRQMNQPTSFPSRSPGQPTTLLASPATKAVPRSPPFVASAFANAF